MKKACLFIALVGVLTLTGAGCGGAKPQQNSSPVSLPKLDISSPGLATSTWRDSIHIIGTTDAKLVWMKNVSHETYQGGFDIVVNLDKDENIIPVAVGNGSATTTIDIKVSKVAPAPQAPGTKTTTTSPKVTTRTPATTSKTPSANPKSTPAPLAVSFSGSEMQTSIGLDSYGATLSWTRSSSVFQSYVIVKSTTDPNLYFPKQFWIKAFNDIDTRTWRDSSVAAGKTTYYRVCKIAPDQSVTCGNVAQVTK